jgi:hypothetical protein
LVIIESIRLSAVAVAVDAAAVFLIREEVVLEVAEVNPFQSILQDTFFKVSATQIVEAYLGNH